MKLFALAVIAIFLISFSHAELQSKSKNLTQKVDVVIEKSDIVPPLKEGILRQYNSGC